MGVKGVFAGLCKCPRNRSIPRLNMEKRVPHDLLTKYLKGECTPDEIAAVDKWLALLDAGADDPRLRIDLEAKNLQLKMLAEIRRRAALEPQPRVQPKTRVRMFTPFRIAATILLLALVGATLVLITKQQSGIQVDQEGISLPEIVAIHNSSSAVEEHRLPDGSLIKLNPNGTIEYTARFDAATREVKLIGEAFFDVTKDKTRPFIINAHDVMVKVLGTSFSISANENDPEVKVAVKTGRVSVSRPANDAPGPHEVILTPNQQVIYNMVREDFSKQIVATPQIILATPTIFHMEYDAAPVNEIFQVLQKNYGIDILYDEKVLSSCALTTRMEEEGFYERIEIICQAIGATYEVQDAKVLIKSAGCHESSN
jgi:transmembrane sensor